MTHKRQKKLLSAREALTLLGAEDIERIGPVRLDPISLRVLATRIAGRLVSRGGRPTDAAWQLQRKVPMKKSTWKRLNEKAAAFAGEGIRVAPGQLAAIALEEGLPYLERKSIKDRASFTDSTRYSEYEPSPESEEEARRLCPAISEGGFWG